MMEDKTGLEFRFWPQIIIDFLTGKICYKKHFSAGIAELAGSSVPLKNSTQLGYSTDFIARKCSFLGLM